MTRLNGPVRRVTVGAYRGMTARPRALVVTLEPGDFISFRELGTRKIKVKIEIGKAYADALRKTILGR